LHKIWLWFDSGVFEEGVKQFFVVDALGGHQDRRHQLVVTGGNEIGKRNIFDLIPTTFAVYKTPSACKRLSPDALERKLRHFRTLGWATNCK